MYLAYKLILLLLILIPGVLPGQLSTDYSSHAVRPALYSLDSTVVFDTVYTLPYDTLLFYPKTNVMDFNDTTLITLIEDSLYTENASFYVKKDVFRIENMSDTIFFVTSPDTAYFFKRYEYFYHDYVFIFNLPQDTPEKNIGSLIASPPYSGDWSYTWFRYDTSYPGEWDSTGYTSSSIDSLESGGYKITLSNADDGEDTSFVGWVHNNDLQFNLNLMKSNGDTIDNSRFYCGRIVFDGFFEIDSFFYYDHTLNDTAYWLNDTISFSWSSDCESVPQPDPYTEDAFIKNVTGINFNHYSPLPQNTWYYATASDVFGGERTDQLFYKTIETEARMKVTYRAADEDMWTVDGEPEGSGPIRVLFVDESLNAGKRQWVADDPYQFEQSLNILGETDGNIFDHYYIYYVPGEYMPMLITSTPEECTDTLRFEDMVNVVPSEIDIPNVFTPNDDGINDVFTIYSQSLREFEIAIYDRWGKRVYHYDGDINDWDGWSGKIKNSERNASPGEYFYVITAKGWEHSPPVEYKTKDYTGSFYLYR